jgi:tRNA(Ile)-lysidine synthase TilS/MesJ
MNQSPFVTFEVVPSSGEVFAHSTARVCARCVLPETFPALRFDDAGVCSYCDLGDVPTTHARAGLVEAIRPLLEPGAPERRYDCLALFSGGKDSSMALIELVRTYRLRVLAFTLDNGFVSSATHRNMRSVLDRLEVDHVTVRPAAAAMQRLYKLSLTEPFDAETTKYATAACGSCISVVLATAREIAAEKRIPLLAGGWTPGQLTNAPVVAGSFLAAVAARHFGPLSKRDGLAGTLRRFHDVGEAEPAWPSLFNPLYGAHYGEEQILDTLRDYGWIRPSDTDSCSTNCRLNGFLIVHHLLTYGYHPYVYEFAQHVRAGYATRDEALDRMRRIRVDVRAIRRIEAELGGTSHVSAGLVAAEPIGG